MKKTQNYLVNSNPAIDINIKKIGNTKPNAIIWKLFTSKENLVTICINSDNSYTAKMIPTTKRVRKPHFVFGVPLFSEGFFVDSNPAIDIKIYKIGTKKFSTIV